MVGSDSTLDFGPYRRALRAAAAAAALHREGPTSEYLSYQLRRLEKLSRPDGEDPGAWRTYLHTIHFNLERTRECLAGCVASQVQRCLVEQSRKAPPTRSSRFWRLAKVIEDCRAENMRLSLKISEILNAEQVEAFADLIGEYLSSVTFEIGSWQLGFAQGSILTVISSMTVIGAGATYKESDEGFRDR